MAVYSSNYAGFYTMAMNSVQCLVKSGNDTIKAGATIKDEIKFTLKITVRAVLGVSVDQVAC